MISRVVPFPQQHTPIQGDVMDIVKEYKDGNATVRISNSYYEKKQSSRIRSTEKDCQKLYTTWSKQSVMRKLYSFLYWTSIVYKN